LALSALAPVAVAEDDVGLQALQVIGARKAPEYPPAAMAARFAGTVTIAAVVHADGTLGEMGVVESGGANLGFDEAAMEAIKTWQFSPASLDGTPIDSVGTFTFHFNSSARIDRGEGASGGLDISHMPVGGIVGKSGGGRSDGGNSTAGRAHSAIATVKLPGCSEGIGGGHCMYDRSKLLKTPRRSIRAAPSGD
jgi:TonB family protein